MVPVGMQTVVDDSPIRPIVKYLLFFFNFVFWIIGCGLIAVGTWAYLEKNRFSHFEIHTYYDVLFDVAIGVFVVGSIVFIIAFAGCLGALRENVLLLRFFALLLSILFVVEVVSAILIFLYNTKVQEKLHNMLRKEGIKYYRDDPDFQSIFDWVQENFYCCGIGHNGHLDWSLNAYFNCTELNPSPERCGVPYSCCRKPTINGAAQTGMMTGHMNAMCGYGVQKLKYHEASLKVYTTGCLETLVAVAHKNLLILGILAICLSIPQLIGIVLARALASEIQEIRMKFI